MGTETYSWSNQPKPQQGFVTSRTLVAPTVLPVPNQPPPQQRPSAWPIQPGPQQGLGTMPAVATPATLGLGTTPTLVAAPSLPAPNQPATQTALGYAPNRPATQPGVGSWPNRSPAQTGPGDWPRLSAPQSWSSMPEATANPLLKRRGKGRAIVAVSLWSFAGGLFAAPQVAEYADQVLEAGIAWVASWAPSFVRPYLPKPIQAAMPASLDLDGKRVAPSSPAPAPKPAAPAEAAAQPQRKPEAAAEPAKTKAPVAVPRPEPVVTKQPEKQARSRTRPGAHDKVAVSLAAAEAPTPVATAKPKGHKQGGADPFESDGEKETGAPARVAKATPEAAPTKSRPGAGLDDLMNDMGSEGKPQDKRRTSREIDAMLKDVQKSEPPPPPKRAAPQPLPPLTASDIAKVMAGVKSSASACGKRFGQNGVADLKLSVGTNGRVSNVAVHGKLADSPAGACVAQAARGAVFPRSGGLTFDYRIDVR
jgi:hypothetical protein